MSLAESLLAIAVAVTVVALLGAGYGVVNAEMQSRQMVEDTAALATRLQSTFSFAGYSGIDVPTLTSAKILPFKSFSTDGTTLSDIRMNPVALSGGPASLALLFTASDADQCMRLATSAASYAYRIRVGPSVSASTGALAGASGVDYKLGSTVTSSALGDPNGCANGNALVGIELH
ncbi:hypothetical protein [Noviherbaspirillum galbum]|uniref:Type 4 secretion system PilS N-terminal domain-containing protein n=1 Tax=Noviherbaspirillum galbum TaxID=2709383 RepID=A0A6B3SUY4_9BURK|nr:hypothetical protein [Noviherbaspirillum galbum]NEX64527.1 hypothetical protein [Noviherbaspirillum galbum]